jgi:hypothetical protein
VKRPRIALTVLVALAAFAFVRQGPRTPAVPAASHYPAGAAGWDVSFPQCGRQGPPPGSFGIVGLNAGRPFTVNPCLSREWGWADGLLAPSLYVNAAYARVYERHLTPACRAAAPVTITDPKERRAWAFGCQEAAFDVAAAPTVPAAWWLDVEPANSWSKRHPELNRLVIQALATGLGRATGRRVGLYSYDRAWTRITGETGWSPLGTAGNWVAPTVHVTGATAASRCMEMGFSGLPVALVQFLSSDSEGAYDADHAC